MNICSNCGVELEPELKVCPICEEPVISDSIAKNKNSGNNKSETTIPSHFDTTEMSRPQRKAIWEIASIILIMLIIVTFLVNYIINHKITWSEYPVAVCLIFFAYISSFSFLNQKREIQLLCAVISSSIFIFALDLLTGSRTWALPLGIPLLFFVNIIFAGLILVIRHSRQRGINLIAYSFLATALLCVCIEATIDLYLNNQINLFWSLIVCACLLPVAVVLLFMHYKLKKGRNLKKTFHI